MFQCSICQKSAEKLTASKYKTVKTFLSPRFLTSTRHALQYVAVGRTCKQNYIHDILKRGQKILESPEEFTLYVCHSSVPTK